MSKSTIAEKSRISRVGLAAAAGQTPIVSDGISIQNGHGALFAIQMGTIAATGVVTIKGERSDDNSSFEDILGSEIILAPADSDGVAILEISEVSKKWARVTVTRTIADSTIDSILAIATGPQISPVGNDASVVDQVLIGSATAGTP